MVEEKDQYNKPWIKLLSSSNNKNNTSEMSS
jgi:hypothetical protein